MQEHVLGESGLDVSATGLGCMGLDFGYANPVSKEAGIALIRAAARRWRRCGTKWPSRQAASARAECPMRR